MGKAIFQTEIIELGEQVDAFLRKVCLYYSETMYQIH